MIWFWFVKARREGNCNVGTLQTSMTYDKVR